MRRETITKNAIKKRASLFNEEGSVMIVALAMLVCEPFLANRRRERIKEAVS